MVKIIMGLKGSGKTKQLLEDLQKALNVENGLVVCIEKDPNLRYSIPSQARHVYTSYYGGKGLDFFKGFISGMHAENYDITHIFIDGLYKIIDGNDNSGVDEFIKWLAKLSETENMDVTMTISADLSDASDTIKAYI